MSHTEYSAGTNGHSSTDCPTCEPQTPLRNHFFFGKLMDVPDFNVEQAYVVEKFKRHHQRLHGSGVVCGLKVSEHPNPACRDRYLVVGPGSALDCCGNEILVLLDEILDIRTFPEVKKLIDTPDQQSHILQLCVRYCECPTEEVPVLYDECGCDDTQCAPNRILESYAFEMHVLAELPPPVPPNAPTLEWSATIAPADAKAVALHTPTSKLYVAADLSPTGGTVEQYELGNLAPVASHNFTNAVLALAPSQDGSRLFVLVAGATTTDPATLEVLDTSTSGAFAGASLASVPISDSAGASLYARVISSGALATLASTSSKSVVQIWDVSAATPAATSGMSATVFAELRSLALGSDGKTLYGAGLAATFHSFDASSSGLNPQTISVASASDVLALDVVRSTKPDLLAWIEGTGKKFRLAQADGTVVADVALTDTPIAFVVDALGNYAYLLAQPATGSPTIQSVALQRALANKPPVLGAPTPVGAGANALALGDRLFVSEDDGVAVLEIQGTLCCDALGPHDCPGCDTPDCIVLATIVGWKPGFKLQDVVDPADATGDLAAGIARLDNRLGRVVVPSVSDLARAIECLCQSVSGVAEPGAPGKDGIDGEDGEDGTDGKDGKDGKDGVGLDWYLPHICDFNWEHGMIIPRSKLRGMLRLVVAFDTKMRRSDLHRDSVRVCLGRFDEEIGVPLWCWCDLDIRMVGGNLSTKCDAQSDFMADDSATFVTALQLGLPPKLVGIQSRAGELRLRILINGDFIRGIHLKSKELKALDGDHLPKTKIPSPPGPPSPGETPEWMEPQDARYSGDGVEGGTFESWFTVRDE
jgi:hypothetical protein